MTQENRRFTSAADESAMEGIAITYDAYAAIAAALPQGVDARPVEPASGKSRRLAAVSKRHGPGHLRDGRQPAGLISTQLMGFPR